MLAQASKVIQNRLEDYRYLRQTNIGGKNHGYGGRRFRRYVDQNNERYAVRSPNLRRQTTIQLFLNSDCLVPGSKKGIRLSNPR